MSVLKVAGLDFELKHFEEKNHENKYFHTVIYYNYVSDLAIYSQHIASELEMCT